MFHRTFTKILTATALLSAPFVHAAPMTISSFDNGWYASDGLHIPENDNTITGYGTGYRSFFAFNLASLGSSSFTSLSITFVGGNGDNEGYDLAKRLDLYDFSGSVTDLLRGAGGTSAWSDLGSGTMYGSTTVTKTAGYYEGMPEITVTLNQVAIDRAMAAAAGGSADFVVGATFPDSYTGMNEALWSYSGMTPAARLNVGFDAPVEVPEPTSLVLLGLGLLGLAATRKRMHG